MGSPRLSLRERLHPVLLETAEALAAWGELYLNSQIRQQLAQVSRSTLARRLTGMRSPKARRVFTTTKAKGRLRSQGPLDRCNWTETRPGVLSIDLVEHNGGSSLGHFAYTLNVVDVVSAYSRRQAVLGRSQRAVFEALTCILDAWPFTRYRLHSDNGGEFLNDHLVRFTRGRAIEFTRSRPYHKNDNPYVEQKNYQFVREIVGYERYDSPEEVDWLNHVYAVLDPYANLFLPSRKLIDKSREGKRTRKTYDQARSPFQRLVELGVLDSESKAELDAFRRGHSPLQLHRQLERIIAAGPDGAFAASP